MVKDETASRIAPGHEACSNGRKGGTESEVSMVVNETALQADRGL